LFFLMSELYTTYFNNKLSHDNVIEKCSSEHIQKKKKEKKDKKMQNEVNIRENKAVIKQSNCRE